MSSYKMVYLWAIALFVMAAKVLACRDTFHSCGDWSSAGMCQDEKFGFVMRGGCTKTCGFCKVGGGELPSFELKHHKQAEAAKKEIFPVSFDATTATTPTTATPPTPATTASMFPVKPLDGSQKGSKSQKRVPEETKPTSPVLITTVTTVQVTRKGGSGIGSTRPMGNMPQGTCKDIFPKCKLWKNEKKMCSNKKLEPYMKFGCRSSCNFCVKSVVNAPLKPQVGILSEGGSGDAVSPNPDAKMDKVEWVIAREMIQREKDNTLKHHSLSSAKRSGIPEQNSALNRKRVEIEAGDAEPSPLTSLGKILNGNPKFFNGESKNLLDSIDSLDNLPTALKDSIKLGSFDAGKLFKSPKGQSSDKGFETYTEHFSKDPYIAEYQREEWMKDYGTEGKPYRRHLNSKKPRGGKHE